MESGATRNIDERRYVHLSPDTINNVSEGLGINNLSSAVAKELAEDVTYRLREIADVCSQFLRHSRKRKLTTDILNKAFKCKNIDPVIGHKKNRILGCDSFEYLPEGDVYIESEREINLVSESLQGDLVNTDSQVVVSASWISLQGVALNSLEDGKVNPSQSSLTAVQHQYYTNITNHLLGDSQQLCLAALQDLRQNTRLTPLLPYLVTFSRLCLNRYKENPVITSRLIRLISAMFSNPHINLSPKPYLSYLVSSLLTFLIKENKDYNPLEHVQLAATVLSKALLKWATPTNQLRAQTLRALRENSGNHLSYAQYGSLASLCILGPEVLQECLLPSFTNLLSGLWTMVHQMSKSKITDRSLMGNQSLGMLLLAGSVLIDHWRETSRQSYTDISNIYELLSQYFGDALVPYIRKENRRGHIKGLRDIGKLRIRRIRGITHSQATGARPEQGELFRDSRRSQSDLFSSPDNFNFLADMGVPSDIFETGGGDLDSSERNADLSGYYKPRTVNLSESTQRTFPESRPFRFRAKAIKLNLGPCRQMEPDTYSQKKTGPSIIRRLVPWRNLVVGGRGVSTNSTSCKVSRMPDYLDVLAS